MRPTTRSTPVRRQGQPQTEIRSCENPRMRVCSPTSQGFAPTVARSSYQQLLARLWRGRVVAPPSLTKDIRGWAKARKACSLRMDRMVRAPCPRGSFTSGASESHRNEFVVIDRLRVGNHAEGAELLERMPNDVDRLRAKRAVGGKAADLRVVNPR